MSNIFCQVIFQMQPEKLKRYLKATIFQSEFWLRTQWPGQDFIAPIVVTASRDNGGFPYLSQKVGYQGNQIRLKPAPGTATILWLLSWSSCQLFQNHLIPPPATPRRGQIT
jgi:hypothetical protein